MPVSDVFMCCGKISVQTNSKDLACPEVYGDHLNQAMQAREPVASPPNSIVIQDHVLLQNL